MTIRRYGPEAVGSTDSHDYGRPSGEPVAPDFSFAFEIDFDQDGNLRIIEYLSPDSQSDRDSSQRESFLP
jgi:hypothetical protein